MNDDYEASRIDAEFWALVRYVPVRRFRAWIGRHVWLQFKRDLPASLGSIGAAFGIAGGYRPGAGPSIEGDVP